MILIETDTGRQRSIDVNGLVLGLAFAPDNQTMYVAAGANGAVNIVDISRGTTRSSFNVGEHVRTMDVSPDGRTLLTVGISQNVKLWEAATGRELTTLPGNMRALAPAMGFAPDGQTLAAAGQDGSLRLVSARTGKEQFARLTQGAVSLLAFLKDGKTLAVGSTFADDQRKGRAIRFYHLETMQIGASLEDDSSPQNSWVYSAARNQIVGESAVLDGGMVGAALKFWDADTRKEANTFSVGRGFGTMPLAVSPDGKTVAYPRYSFGAGATLQIALVDASSGKEFDALTVPQGAGRSQQLAFSADGKTLGSIGFDRALHLWEVAARKQLAPTTTENRTVDVSCFAFSPIDSLIASVISNRNSNQGRLVLWDLSTGSIKQQVEIQGGQPPATVAFSPDGKLVAGSASDGKLTIWNATSGEVVKDWTIPGLASQLVFSAGGEALVTGNANGTVFVFRLK
jgi:WD40 repeat protein